MEPLDTKIVQEFEFHVRAAGSQKVIQEDLAMINHIATQMLVEEDAIHSFGEHVLCPKERPGVKVGE
jgi:hypothetical protein